MCSEAVCVIVPSIPGEIVKYVCAHVVNIEGSAGLQGILNTLGLDSLIVGRVIFSASNHW